MTTKTADTYIAREIILIGGTLFFMWLFTSTLLFLCGVVLGMGICLFATDAAVCSNTISDIFYFAFFEVWINILRIFNPMFWVNGGI